MTSLKFMQMTTLAQDTTNLVAQFVRIVLKILAPYLRNQAKLFLDNMAVKGLKITYNNEKVAPGIRRYVFKHIQNLDKILTNLKQVGIIIARAEFQFCQASLKIVDYICDAAGYHPDTLKVLKILDRPECTNVISVHAFIRVCVYYQILIKNFAQVISLIYHVFKKNISFV